MNPNDPLFWITIASIVIAVCFIVMAIALIAIAIIVRRVIGTVNRLQEQVSPLLVKVDAISTQGKEISVQLTEVTANLSTASKYFAESSELIKEEVAEIRQLVGSTALVAMDKVEMVSQTIDRTHGQVVDTTEFVQQKIVVPAREIAAVMAGVRKALEVLFAPSPKQIDRVYTEDELFIG
jgi:hypothetical protein